MFLVGLTGGIASGKSTVADRLVAHHRFHLVDADVVAREVVLPGTPVWQRIVEHFGREVVGDDDFLDRARLASIVFADRSQLAVLNELTHPAILREIASELEELRDTDRIVVLDVALLTEIGASLGFDAIVTVAASPQLREQRLVEHRGMDREHARQRIDAQAPLEDLLAISTHVIHNEGSQEDLRRATDAVAAELVELARVKHGA